MSLKRFSSAPDAKQNVTGLSIAVKVLCISKMYFYFLVFPVFFTKKGMGMFKKRTPLVALNGGDCFELMRAYVSLVLCKRLIILWCIYQWACYKGITK